MGILTNSIDGYPTPVSKAFLVGIPLCAIGHYRAQQYPSEYSLNDSFLSYIYIGRSIELTIAIVLLSLGLTWITLDVIQQVWKDHDNTSTTNTNTNTNKSASNSTLTCSLTRKETQQLLLRKQWLRAEATPSEIMQELTQLLEPSESSSSSSSSSSSTKTNNQNRTNPVVKYYIALFCLDALSTHVCHQRQRTQNQDLDLDKELDFHCQTAAYLVLRNIPNYNNIQNDDSKLDGLVAEAISLLALIAKHPHIRARHIQQPEEFGFHIPLAAIQQSLSRTQQQQQQQNPTSNNDNDDNNDNYDTLNEAKEQLAAELQRKACLFLGAIADGNVQMATTIVHNEYDSKSKSKYNGLQTILNALQWFRYHEHVGNWGLWAIFVLCYEHTRNKNQLIHLGGVPIVCDVMKYNVHCMEVQRHGTAILFDLMREGAQCSNNNSSVTDEDEDEDISADSLIRVRDLALNAGLHQVVHQAMVHHKTCMEIMMMGREMLVATHFQGDIPVFDGALVPHEK